MGRPGRRQKATLVKRDGPNCHWCGVLTQTDLQRSSTFQTIDHVIPRSLGGVDAQTNLVIACFLCNARRNRWRFRKKPELLFLERYKVYDKNDPIFFRMEMESYL